MGQLSLASHTVNMSPATLLLTVFSAVISNVQAAEDRILPFYISSLDLTSINLDTLTGLLPIGEISILLISLVALLVYILSARPTNRRLSQFVNRNMSGSEDLTENIANIFSKVQDVCEDFNHEN